jgi:AcrR family transcriptional regulator
MYVTAEMNEMADGEPTGRPPSAKRRTQAERTALSDSRMYDAAIELICETGTHNTTLKDVGERAGYSRGLASNRFGSKEALFANLIQDFNTRWAIELERHLDGRTGLKAIFAALESVEDFLIEQSRYMKAMYILWYEAIGSHSEVREQLAAHHRAYRRDICRWVQQGISDGSIIPRADPDRFAVQFCSFIFGTIYQWLVAPQSIDVRQTFNDYRHIITLLTTDR